VDVQIKPDNKFFVLETPESKATLLIKSKQPAPCELSSLASFQGVDGSQQKLICISREGSTADIMSPFQNDGLHVLNSDPPISLPGLKFRDFFIVKRNQTLIALSNTGIDGTGESTFHTFRLSNVLAWERSSSISAAFSWNQ